MKVTSIRNLIYFIYDESIKKIYIKNVDSLK